MGRPDLLTLRIGLTCTRRPRPPDFVPEVKSSMHCPMAPVTLPGMWAFEQDPGPRTSWVSPGGLVDRHERTSRVPESVPRLRSRRVCSRRLEAYPQGSCNAPNLRALSRRAALTTNVGKGLWHGLKAAETVAKRTLSTPLRSQLQLRDSFDNVLRAFHDPMFELHPDRSSNMQNRCFSRFIAFSMVLAIAEPVFAGTLYVANHGGDTGHPNTIEQFTSGGVGSVFANTGNSSYPTGLAFDSAGYLYASMETPPHTGESIVKFTPGGVGSVFVSAGLSDPGGLAFDNGGNLYVANQLANTITKTTPGGVGSVFASTGLSNPIGLAFDRSGNLYVTNNHNNTIERFTPGGVGSVFASTGLSNPYGLAFDASGNLYVANNGNNTIERFTPGGVGSVFASTGLSGPGGLAFDSSGNLFAVNFNNNTIEEFTPGGVGSVFASTGLSSPTFIAIEPGLSSVPEPSSFVLLALAAAGTFCGWLFNRRRRADSEGFFLSTIRDRASALSTSN